MGEGKNSKARSKVYNGSVFKDSSSLNETGHTKLLKT